MDNKNKTSNGYDKILDTYNKYKHPIIKNQMNALVFPWSMQRDVDAIDTLKFAQNPTLKQNDNKPQT